MPYSSIIRSGKYQSRLLGFLRQEYDIKPTAISPANRGFYGETWKVDTSGRSYFVKLDYSTEHRGVYERSFSVMEHLWTHGIDFVSRVVKTTDGRLSTHYDGAVLGVFEWIDGKNIETDATKTPEYQMLAKIYTVPLGDLSIAYEDFTRISSDKFFEQWNALKDEKTRNLFEANRSKLEYRAKRLNAFAAACKSDTDGFVITHGDAGGNLIVSCNKHYLIDWDDPILAPPERDAWNMLCYKGKEWAGCIFHKALRDNGIVYTLRSERLAYYCYHSYFFYLTEYLDHFTRPGIKEEIEQYFEGWAENRASYADENFVL